MKTTIRYIGAHIAALLIISVGFLSPALASAQPSAAHDALYMRYDSDPVLSAITPAIQTFYIDAVDDQAIVSARIWREPTPKFDGAFERKFSLSASSIVRRGSVHQLRTVEIAAIGALNTA